MELRGEALLGRASAASAVARFCKGIVDAVGPYVVAVKPQAAFFEALARTASVPSRRSATTRARQACSSCSTSSEVTSGRRPRVRGCILSHVRDGPPLADAMTASPYLGYDSVERSGCRRRHGAACSSRPRRTQGRPTQDLALSDSALSGIVAARAVERAARRRRGMSSVGAIEGATYPRAVSGSAAPADSPMLFRCQGAVRRPRMRVARSPPRPGDRHRRVSRSVIMRIATPRPTGARGGSRAGSSRQVWAQRAGSAPRVQFAPVVRRVMIVVVLAAVLAAPARLHPRLRPSTQLPGTSSGRRCRAG
jgi:hypothetical protein